MWHSLAKLRLHTERTVTDLENSTTRLGSALRTFQKEVCSSYLTYELPSEEAARGRRKAAMAKKTAAPLANTTTGTAAKKGKAKATDPVPTQAGKKKLRTLNLNTYKVHALGAYANAIRKYGSPDNYNSQTVRSSRFC